ncbi:winged helix-turn-helix domain-containing protein [Puerhibacterium sp. TATVAM-FAB25]|uniref:winged helix-turn-helix domain-containing protein n=1 Tax=Puerhibacterium sp. TATVAM-FAB25 TaxID=3093699 RepID=UPI00397A3059
MSHPADAARPAPGTADPSWTFLTHHGHVLLAVARLPDARVADIAARVGISPGATLAILKDLEQAGYVHRRRVGRRTHYTADPHRHFRHPADAAHQIGELLAIFAAAPRRS